MAPSHQNLPGPPSREFNDSQKVLGELLRTPFVSSFLSEARQGDVHDPDVTRRSQAWAAWAVSSLVRVSTGEREYSALRLPGSFYDPNNQGPKVVPHLEIPRKVASTNHPEFPFRLALFGNALLFPYWRYSEVTAVRRALFNTVSGPVDDVVALLASRRANLVTGLELVNAELEPHWQSVSEFLFSNDVQQGADATDDFTPVDVQRYLPSAYDLDLHVRFDEQLLEKNHGYTARRVGVWQVHGRAKNGKAFSFGVATPRLTVNSLFNDPLFVPSAESLGALLVRALLLRRIAARRLNLDAHYTVGDPTPSPRAYLRAVPARPGAKLPEASTGAVMRFLADFPDPEAAWQALERWGQRGYLLTTTPEGFRQAHAAASRAWRRVEEPDRSDIDVVLPLAWDMRDGKAQVVRVTYSSDTQA